jgi:hypothetical protein
VNAKKQDGAGHAEQPAGMPGHKLETGHDDHEAAGLELEVDFEDPPGEERVEFRAASTSTEVPEALGPISYDIDIGKSVMGAMGLPRQVARAGFIMAMAAGGAFVASLIPVFIVMVLVENLLGLDPHTKSIVGLILMGILVLAAVVLIAPFSWRTSMPSVRFYVGAHGVTRSERIGDLPTGTPKVFFFAHAFALKCDDGSETHPRRDGSFVHFDYRWLGSTGAAVFRLRGSYAKKDGKPADDFARHSLARAVVAAWNEHLVGRARRAVAEGGFLEFIRDTNDASRRARIGEGYVELIDGARIERWPCAEIDAFKVERGDVTITRRDTHRGQTSEHRYPGGAMENQSFFLLALWEIGGVKADVVEGARAPQGRPRPGPQAGGK